MEEFVEEFASMAVFSMIDFFSEYDQVELDPESRDMTAFQTPMELLQQTTLSQETTNLPAQFSCITRKILEHNISHDCESYFDNVGIKGPKTKYNEKKIFPGVRCYIFEHLQQLNHTLVSIELAGARISGAKSQWCQSRIIVVGFVCDYDGRKPETAKIAQIVNWPPCANITEARAFIEVCVYYQIWIKDFAIIAQSIYFLF